MFSRFFRQSGRSDAHRQRLRMVETQLRARGIRDARVLEAMSIVPRELFVPQALASRAYEDVPLPIGCDQTISQPFIVAYMLELLDVSPDCRVLEVGCGTGYQAALLGWLAREVYTIERIPELCRKAGENLRVLKLEGRVHAACSDGTQGLADHAPFDRIIVAAAAPAVPEPLTRQLGEGGIMVAPVGPQAEQTIVRITRENGRLHEKHLLGCRFVRLIGEAGWTQD